jgi:hypothetical protein
MLIGGAASIPSCAGNTAGEAGGACGVSDFAFAGGTDADFAGGTDADFAGGTDADFAGGALLTGGLELFAGGVLAIEGVDTGGFESLPRPNRPPFAAWPLFASCFATIFGEISD